MSSKNVMTRADLLKSFEQLEKQFGQALNDAKEKEQAFETLRQNFHKNLGNLLQTAQKRLPENNPLAQEVGGLLKLLADTQNEWDKKIAGRDRGVSFRQGFNDSLLVFVYGKVKSGKSSLGNYVAWGHTDPDTVPNLKQLVQAALKPQYFSHDRTQVASGDAHKEAETKQEFRVGALEATSSIQGFRLPGLTWVDSPGLHSVNEENGQLARDYVEHADLILYTMKSDAPARESDVKEIQELFRKDKRTVLLLTGSDTTEEDEDENGNLIQVTVMKSAETRAKQREYVAQALGDSVANAELVSFSARYAQQHADEPALFQDSGMGQFFAIMSELIHAEGVAMKKRVPMTNFRNFMDGCVRDIAPYHDLLSDFEQTIKKLEEKLPRSIAAEQSKADLVIRQLLNREFDYIAQLNDSEKQNAIQAAQQQLSQKCNEIALNHLEAVLVDICSDFQQQIIQNFNSSNLVQLPEFSVEMAEHEVATRVVRGTRKRNSGWGSLLGAVGGFFLGGPIGAAAGGLLGSASGSDASVKHKTISVAVGDNFQEIRHAAMTACTEAVKNQIAQTADKLLKPTLRESQKLLEDLSDEVKHMENQLKNLHDEVNHALKQLS